MNRAVILISLVTLVLLGAGRSSAQVVWTDYTGCNTVTDIAVEDNYLWCATKGGVVRWDTRDGTYVKYTTADGLAGMHVCSVAVDADHVKWFGTNGQGISRFDGETWTTFTSEYVEAGNTVYDIAVDANNVKWFGTWHGLTRFDGETWKTYEIEDGLSSNNIYTVAVDGNNVLWVGSYGFPVSFDGISWTIYGKESGFPSQAIYDIYVDPVTNVKWFAGYYYVFSFDVTVLETFEKTSHRTIAIDYDGTIWVGSDDRGISSYDGEMWVNYMMQQPSLRHINAIAVTPDNMKWFGVSGGLLRFDGAAWTTYVTDDTPSGEAPYDQEIHMIAVDSNNVKWIAARGGVYTYDGAVWTRITEETLMPQWDIGHIAFGADNVIWFGSGEGLKQFDGARWTTFSESNGLFKDDIGGLAVDKDNVLWVGYDSTERVISSFDGERWRTHNLGSTDEVRVWSIMVDKNNVKWVMGTARGVYTECYSSADGITWKLDHIGGAMAFGSDDRIWYNNEYKSLISYDGLETVKYRKEKQFTTGAIAVDHRNVIWMGSSLGELVRFDGYNWSYYASSDGFIGDEVRCIAVDADNIKWIGTNHGIASVDDSAVPVTVESFPTPTPFSLDTPYPNPFNLSVTIPFSLPEAARVDISIYSITGQKVRELCADRLLAGSHALRWDGCDDAGAAVSSGLYIVRATNGKHAAARKVVLVK